MNLVFVTAAAVLTFNCDCARGQAAEPVFAAASIKPVTFRRPDEVVFKPGGRVICNESLAHNPVFHWYRKHTPHLRTPWEVPHILRVRDIRRASQYFDSIDIQFHYFFCLLAVPLRRSSLFGPVLSVLEAVDTVLLRVPGVQLLAWQSTFELSGPKGK